MLMIFFYRFNKNINFKLKLLSFVDFEYDDGAGVGWGVVSKVYNSYSWRQQQWRAPLPSFLFCNSICLIFFFLLKIDFFFALLLLTKCNNKTHKGEVPLYLLCNRIYQTFTLPIVMTRFEFKFEFGNKKNYDIEYLSS